MKTSFNADFVQIKNMYSSYQEVKDVQSSVGVSLYVRYPSKFQLLEELHITQMEIEAVSRQVEAIKLN